MLEVKVEEGSSLYSCDSGYTSNKYMVGGNSGTLFYMAGVKSYEWTANFDIIFICTTQTDLSVLYLIAKMR